MSIFYNKSCNSFILSLNSAAFSNSILAACFNISSVNLLIVSLISSAFSNYINSSDKDNRIIKIQTDQVGFAKSLSEIVERDYKWKLERGIEITKVAIAGIDYDEESRINWNVL